MVVCPVWLKHELEGVICIHETGDPLGDLEIQAAEHAATVIALHIARDRAVVNVEQRLRYSFIDTLLDGQFSGDTLREAGNRHHRRRRVVGWPSPRKDDRARWMRSRVTTKTAAR